jgi:hypothetical protein
MKNTIATISLVIGLSFTANAQDVPSTISTSFSKKFPDAKAVKWEKENAEEWEAEFRMDGINYSANYSADGKWKETEQKILVNDLPNPIKSMILTKYSSYKIDQAEILETPDFKGYEVELENKEQTIILLLDKSGKIIKEEIEKEEADD